MLALADALNGHGKMLYGVLAALFAILMALSGLVWNDQRAKIEAQTQELVWVKRYILEQERLQQQRLEHLDRAVSRLTWGLERMQVPGFVPYTDEQPQTPADPRRHIRGDE